MKVERDAQGNAPAWLVWVALITVYIVWGSTYLAIRVAVTSWEPFLFGGLRFAAAGTIVILAMRLRGVRVPRDTRLLRETAIAGTLLLVGGNAAVILAERHVPSGITAVMVSTMPIWTVVISALTPRGHRLGPLNLIGLLAGLAGVAVLVTAEGEAAGEEESEGDDEGETHGIRLDAAR
mgnify:CR=1 FL=1